MNTPARSGGDGWGGGVRRYGAADLRRLRFIRAAQGAGFTLDEIGDLLALGESDDRPRVRALARQRIAALDEKIAQMTQTRAALARLERSEEHTSELQSLMRISYAVFCLKKKKQS